MKGKTGLAPVLSVEIEEDLKDWIIAMQSQGLPVTRDTILAKGNKIYQQMYGVTRGAGSIGRGWLDRFLRRYPILTLRTSHVIKRVRAEATEDGLRIFFNEMLKHSMEGKLTPDRIFNMDETGFAQKSKASFHITIVACAGVFVVPSMFIVPGQRLNCNAIDGYSIDNSTISVAVKGFMTAKLFLKSLVHFENQVPGAVKDHLYWYMIDMTAIITTKLYKKQLKSM